MFQRVKGTVDLFPSESYEVQTIMGKMCVVCNKYGYAHVLTPSIESIKLLTAKSGEEVKQQIFTLQKKSTEELGLKFDLTVPMTRMFISKQKEMPKPVKWYSADRMWRYEAPQKGREREFFQISIENFGSDKPETDAETINLFIDCLLSTGLKPKDFTLKINHRKLLEGILLDIVDKKKLDAVIRVVDKNLEQLPYVAEMNKIGINKVKAEKIRHATQIKGSIAEVEKKIKKHLKLNATSQEGLDNLKQTLKLVKHSNIVVDLAVARGLAYYTGCVFEAFDAAGQFRALGGGGRYDSLVQLLGGDACPATGFAIGYSTLSLLLQSKKLTPKAELGPDYYIAPINEKFIPDALKIANQLRTKYTVDVDMMRRNIGKQFNYANSIGAKNVIVIGPAEIKSKKFTIKDMKTGKETKKKISQL